MRVHQEAVMNRYRHYLPLLAALVALPAWSGDGRAVYEKHCASCHSGSDVNIPQPHNPSQWNARLKAGRKSLIDSVVNGHNIMPPLGGEITKDAIGDAVDYIVGTVGGYPK
jgi:cytochrome c5